MPTIFIAVECCQCSTMQVKQSTKTNKWTCVVCNQKQSVRQVFAQGPMARDLRPFVQSSNMARQRTDQTPNQQQKQNSPLPPSIPYNTQKKRPTDWTQYLDPEDYDRGTDMKQEEYEEGCGFEPEIVTELPAELFKKPKLNKYCDESESDTRKGGVDELHNHKPFFCKRHFNKHVVCPEDEEQRKDELTIAKDDTPKLSHLMMQEARTCHAREATPNLTRGTSKWNDYITQDDDDDDDYQNRRKRACDGGQENAEMYKARASYEYETAANDERVEDDIIHPDFL